MAVVLSVGAISVAIFGWLVSRPGPCAFMGVFETKKIISRSGAVHKQPENDTPTLVCP